MPIEIQKTWDDDRLKRERLDRVLEQMRVHGLGSMYLSNTTNIRYLLNVKIPSAQAFVAADGEVVAFVRPRDEGYVKLQFENVQRPIYDNASAWGTQEDGGNGLGRLIDGITDLMQQHGVANEPLAVDELDVPAVVAFIDAGIRPVYAQPVIEFARAFKTQDEVAIYRTIGDQYAHAFRAFRDALRPGITENELSSIVLAAWYEAGGEDVLQINVCAGENMNPWRRWPTRREVREGEFVGLDFHGYGSNGLLGDVSRTFFVGKQPTGEQRDLYARAYDYLHASMDAFRAGRTYTESMELVPPVPSEYENQLYALHIAHCIGMSHSGFPEVYRRRPPIDDTLKGGQVLAIECYFGIEGSPLAVKLEEDIIVRDGAPEVVGPEIPFDERFITP